VLGFAIPAILKDWHVARSVFGPVIAAGLIGMSMGSALAGQIGDRFGRRTALIGTVIVFSLATLATAAVQSIPVFGILRFLAGAGIGGALPNAAAIASEFSPRQRGALNVSLTIVCVPLGGMVGGLTAAWVLPAAGWRALYVIGGVAPLLVSLLLLALLPESPGFVSAHRGGENASVKEVFAAGRLRDTLSLWLACFASLVCVYLSFSWLPAMLTAQGMTLAEASSGLALYNLFGVFGAVGCAFAISRLGSRGPMLAAALLGAASVAALNLTAASRDILFVAFAAHGFFVNAVQTTAFALGAHLYPVTSRASGVAFAIGFGRLGSIFSAFAGAALIASGRLAFVNALALAMLVCFGGLALIRNHIPNSTT
jgi:AAHS family 4-hydroxybenzoate transporter-like MFS transporter